MKIFIAGPLTNGGRITDPRQILLNVWAAMDVANKLISAGHIVECPHLMYYLRRRSWLQSDGPVPERRYAEQALAKLEWCDALVRLPGKSRGADIEAAEARADGKAVYWWASKKDRDRLLGGHR